MSIELHCVSKRFASFQVLNQVSLTIPSGELVALLGPSGCGKTTLLRIIAGMETADSGTVLFSGSDAKNLGVRERRVGFVFQHYALFRHMSVFENVAFGLRVRDRALRPSETEIRQRVSDLLQLVQLDGFAKHYPAELSGGQRQRIALARALAVEPQVLLLDEPFGALDSRVRKDLRRWLRRLHDEMHIASVFVTHDQEEALDVADRVVVMNRGHIEQIGTPDAVYLRPATSFVYQFLGNINVLVDEQGTHYVRPHDVVLTREQLPGSQAARVLRVHPVGPVVRVELQFLASNKNDTPMLVEAELTRERHTMLQAHNGETLYVSTRHVQRFDDSGESSVSRQPYLF